MNSVFLIKFLFVIIFLLEIKVEINYEDQTIGKILFEMDSVLSYIKGIYHYPFLFQDTKVAFDDLAVPDTETLFGMGTDALSLKDHQALTQSRLVGGGEGKGEGLS